MWRYYLPRVELFYFMLPSVIPITKSFKNASNWAGAAVSMSLVRQAEMKLVMNFGAKPDNLIFANPVLFVGLPSNRKARLSPQKMLASKR